jgi:hypothetical protein
LLLKAQLDVKSIFALLCKCKCLSLSLSLYDEEEEEEEELNCIINIIPLPNYVVLIVDDYYYYYYYDVLFFSHLHFKRLKSNNTNNKNKTKN